MLVYIGVGHGGKDPGATYNGLVEKELNLKVAKFVKEAFKKYDCNVVLSRESDTAENDISKRTEQAKELKADCFLEIHHNAGKGKGCEAFCWHTDEKAEKLAKLLISNFIKIGQKSRGVKKSSASSYNFGVCRINARNGIPSVLGEFAFVDNNEDRVLIDSDADLKKEAEAYVNTAVEFLNIPLKKVEVEKKAGEIYFKGGYHYKSSNSDKPVGGKRRSGTAKITSTSKNAKHPYHLVGDTVYGWVDADTIEEKIENPDNSFLVRIKVAKLNYRTGPSTWNRRVGQVKKNEVFTIVETNSAKTWGRLKSGAGWICIKPAYVERI